jgi:phenylpyruvate tautomerase PptA (4-oxalocrotonate tautomerase family)
MKNRSQNLEKDERKMDKTQKVIDFINSISAKHLNKNRTKIEIPISEYYNLLQGVRQLINEK